MTLQKGSEKHIIAFAYHAWGHTRPLVQLSARLVTMHPHVHITLFTTNAFLERVMDELSSGFECGEEACADRVRVVSLGEAFTLSAEAADNNFDRALEKLVAGAELQCAKTGKIQVALPPPTAAIIDFLAINPIVAAKKANGGAIKVYAWFSAMATLAFAEIAPEQYGGPGNIRIKAQKEAMRTGMRVVLSLVFSPTGKVHHFPGLPPMTDYELHPQDFPLPTEFVAHTFPRMNETVEACDGVLFNSATSYEPEAFEQVKTWLSDIRHVGYACGPLLRRRREAANVSVASRLSHNETEIIRFLDNTLNDVGEKSLLYISFGSFFGPARSLEKLWAFLDVVMELGIPFLLSLASPSLGPLPTEVIDKLNIYGKGTLTHWAPQQLVLEHQATGWFVTHGGHNSVSESISAGVPMIVWPFHADQPLNAVRISEVLEIGYELLEVRTGHGTHPLHRNGRKPIGTIDALKAEAKEVLTRAFGEDGARKREELLPLTNAFKREWEEGGASLKDVCAFLHTL
ncbi:hypothetical protein ACG7TL_004502 [Trametes sanguinea]